MRLPWDKGEFVGSCKCHYTGAIARPHASHWLKIDRPNFLQGFQFLVKLIEQQLSATHPFTFSFSLGEAAENTNK
jgi:hypothetical protein